MFNKIVLVFALSFGFFPLAVTGFAQEAIIATNTENGERSIKELIMALDDVKSIPRNEAFKQLYAKGLKVLFRLRYEELSGHYSNDVKDELSRLQKEIRRDFIYRPRSVSGVYSGTVNEIMNRIGLDHDTPLPFLEHDIKIEKSFEFTNWPFWNAVLRVLDDADLGITFDDDLGLRLVHGRMSFGDRCIVGPYLFVRLPEKEPVNEKIYMKIILLVNQNQIPLPEVDSEIRVLTLNEEDSDTFGSRINNRTTRKCTISYEPIDLGGLVAGYILSPNISERNVILEIRSNYRVRESLKRSLSGSNTFDPFWFLVTFK